MLHLDEDRKHRPVRRPRLEAKRTEKVADFRFIEVDNQIVGPVAGALLVARRRSRHLVVIAIGADEVCRARFVRRQSRIAGKIQRTGDLDENILQTGGKADDAVCLALAGDDGLRPIEVGRRGHRESATRQRCCKRHSDDGGRHAKTCRVPRPLCHVPVEHTHLAIPMIFNEQRQRHPHPRRGGANVGLSTNRNRLNTPVVNHRAAIRLDSAARAEEHCNLSPLAANHEPRRFWMTPPSQGSR